MSADDSHRFAKAPHLWALGVGAVVSGDFFGWQAGLSAGFWGLAINLIIVSVLYILLSFSIAELSTSIPCGGGPYAFAHRALGPTAAYFAGLAEVLKVIVTCAVVSVGIGSYIIQLFSWSSTDSGPAWWALFFVLFTVLNVAGIALSFRVQLGATVLSVLILIVFYIGAATQFSYDEWIAAPDMEFTDGSKGLVSGLSFAMWFYLGIEELPLAVEETIDPAYNMPRGLLSSIATLFVLSFCTLFFNSGISPGADKMFASTSPLLDGYKSVFGDNSTTAGFSWLLIVGLLASFHSFIFCMGRLLYAMARDGFLPAVLKKLHPKNHTPYAALIIGSALALILAICLHFAIGDVRLGSVMINLALTGALISYAFQLISFIQLRRHEPELPRPYRSFFGIPGAYACLVLCAYALGSIIYQGVISPDDFLVAVVIAVVYFVGGAVLFYSVIQKNIAHLPQTPGRLDKSLISPGSREAGVDHV
ncbi:Amino Acid-Polyamine-Organocation (APC) Family [Achlya hypogyna]|uniref:Amino Acid-Polyamine-Organocation (APC) Family n=1 Tax=Achlya hypogyna TaxID=1202772 RepID=A0A1V9Z3U7_ACHHY|nr:Amino Acid-Polyamine-Organocation (APC) Family [Achlya hypogyna]